MTKEEAIEAMKNGSRITHQYFTREEFISMDGPGVSYYTDENGYHLPIDQFWGERKSEAFQNGWDIYGKGN